MLQFFSVGLPGPAAWNALPASLHVTTDTSKFKKSTSIPCFTVSLLLE